MTDMTPEAATALRKPFPAESIGKLPKPYQANAPKGNCKECGGYHGLPAAHLDFVGHAATTDRLLTVDPEWNWEPFAIDANGLPALDARGNLWIRLTILGVTRIGIGDGKSLKECIGDAIRNAAMRFGVALDLWAKENLVEFAQAVQSHRTGTDALRAAVEPIVAPDVAEQREDSRPVEPMTDRTRKTLFALFTERGITDRDKQMRGLENIVGHPLESRGDLTDAEAKAAIERLRAVKGEQA